MLRDAWEEGCSPGDRSAHRGVATEPGGTGNTFGSASSKPAPRALTWIDLAPVNSMWT